MSPNASKILDHLKQFGRCSYSYLQHALGDSSPSKDFRTVDALNELHSLGIAERHTSRLDSKTQSTHWRLVP